MLLVTPSCRAARFSSRIFACPITPPPGHHASILPRPTAVPGGHRPQPVVRLRAAQRLQRPVPGRPASMPTSAEPGEHPGHLADQARILPEAILGSEFDLLIGYDIPSDLRASSARLGVPGQKELSGPAGAAGIQKTCPLSRRRTRLRRTRPRTRPASPGRRDQPPARRAGRPASPGQPSARTRTPAHATHTTILWARHGDTSTARWLTRTARTGSVPPRNHTHPLSQIHHQFTTPEIKPGCSNRGAATGSARCPGPHSRDPGR
jgi:hypothetical protein